MRIFVDADACPRAAKDILFRTARRVDLELVLVANKFMRAPSVQNISFVLAKDGPDEADDRIVELCEAGDLVVTADIPLADRVIRKGADVLEPRGDLLTADNIGERLATRNLMEELRKGGLPTGGPNAYGQREKQAFANQLDRYVTQKQKGLSDDRLH